MDEIPEKEIEAAFKEIKKAINGSYIKIYDDGAIKMIDDYGVMTMFSHYSEFLKFARRKAREVQEAEG